MATNKSVQALSPQELIEFTQLATFTFPTDPLPFRLAPPARPVKEKKSSWRARGVSIIQLFDALRGGFENLAIVRLPFGVGIGEIRKQGKVQMLVLVCQICDLKFIYQRRDRGLVAENHRHDDHGAGFGGHAL